jgi:hypothetical protein
MAYKVSLQALIALPLGCLEASLLPGSLIGYYPLKMPYQTPN